ncbi:lipid kinase [Salinisphaera sp. USBA-960]|uniref:lipid kinase n=1 Tax=Salinisphaera orenii TaxID=856731 RepID=UPI000DBE19B8|nr:lipid kinase [Salifodinibacter halophilus]NNC25350.1 lipid kinase [Salifodinibacter halophilus]
MIQALLLINRGSRAGEQNAAEVRDALRANGASVVVRDADTPAHLHAALAAHAGSVDVVVVGGGDGTISMAAGALIQVAVPVAIVPLGTANDLARTLMVPTDIAGACRNAIHGRSQPIDLGQCNDVYFVNVASLGLPVRASKYRSTAAKRWLGPLGYAGNVVTAYRQTEPFDVELVWDDHCKSMHTIQLVVGNGRHFGGGLAVARDAMPDDGALDIYSLAPQTPLGMLAKLPGLVRGPDQELAGVSLFKAGAVRVRTSRPMAINTDGELLTETPADFRVIPGALTIKVPDAYLEIATSGAQS